MFNCGSGTERLMDSLISSLNYIPSAFLDSIHCLRMDYELRGLIGALLQSNSHDDLMYVSDYPLLGTVSGLTFISLASPFS